MKGNGSGKERENENGNENESERENGRENGNGKERKIRKEIEKRMKKMYMNEENLNENCERKRLFIKSVLRIGKLENERKLGNMRRR